MPSSGKTVLIGPNGAGKSTLLRLMAGALRPQAGRILLGAGGVSSVAALRSYTAWMPQEVVAVRGLRVKDQVMLSSWLGGASTRRAKVAADRALERVHLSHLALRRVETLSGGQLRRVGLAETLVRETPLVLLDEPTAGLDPAQRRNFRQLLTSCPNSMLVSTHLLDDIEEVFDHVAVIVDGTIEFSGTIDEFYGLVHTAGRPTAEQVFSYFVPGGTH